MCLEAGNFAIMVVSSVNRQGDKKVQLLGMGMDARGNRDRGIWEMGLLGGLAHSSNTKKITYLRPY